MKIEDLLDNTGKYFKKALLTGDYEFIKCEECTAEILIDGKYTFTVWIANNPKFSFDFYQDLFRKNMELDSIRLTTQKERMLGWKHIKPHIKEYTDKILKLEKQKQINKLKKELEALGQ